MDALLIARLHATACRPVSISYRPACRFPSFASSVPSLHSLAAAAEAAPAAAALSFVQRRMHRLNIRIGKTEMHDIADITHRNSICL